MTTGSGSGPFGVRVLEDLPDIAGKAVLVRATLDLPIGLHHESPMAVHRARLLAETLRWLARRAGAVTVFGDTNGGRSAEVWDNVRTLAAGVKVADAVGSFETPEVLNELIDSHDVFVNDAFQWSYLPLPSLILPAERLPAIAGRSLERDLRLAQGFLHDAERPFMAVLGGDNSSLRLHGLKGLILRADRFLIGGAMSLPFLQATGRRPGPEDHADFLEECRQLVGLAGRVRHHIDLPLDFVVRYPDGMTAVIDARDDVAAEVVDIGPLTRLRFQQALRGARSVLWSGALGRVEEAEFSAGTLAVARALKTTHPPRVVLGGDSLVRLLFKRQAIGADARLISATDPLLEILKSGDLPALVPLRR